jgi:antitoxin CcdA
MRIFYAHSFELRSRPMRAPNDSQPARKPVTITVKSTLLEAARRLKINHSATMEAALTEVVRQKEREKWLAENRAAIAAHSERVKTDGVFSDDLRRF